MSLESLHPFAGIHAIQSMAFAMRWTESLNLEQIELLRSRARSFDGFPHLTDRTHLSINMTDGHGSSQPANVSNTLEITGFVLESATRRSDGAPSISVMVDKEELVVAVKDYSRWDVIKGQVVKILTLFSAVEIDVTISALGLQFSDVFEWRDSWDAFNESLVFNIGNPYMAPNVFGTNSNWHSNHGFIEKLADPVELQRINVINVSRETRKARRLVKVTTSHQMRFRQFIDEWVGLNQQLLWNCWDDAHAKNKDILRSLLTPAVQQKIALT